jgi:hypothetical protein
MVLEFVLNFGDDKEEEHGRKVLSSDTGFLMLKVGKSNGKILNICFFLPISSLSTVSGLNSASTTNIERGKNAEAEGENSRFKKWETFLQNNNGKTTLSLKNIIY